MVVRRALMKRGVIFDDAARLKMKTMNLPEEFKRVTRAQSEKYLLILNLLM